MPSWANVEGLGESAGGRCADAGSPEPGDSSSSSRTKMLSAGCHPGNVSGEGDSERSDNGAVWFHCDTKLSTGHPIALWLRAGAARNEAQDCAHGIHKIIEYRANHKLLRVGHCVHQADVTKCQRKNVMRKLYNGELEEITS